MKTDNLQILEINKLSQEQYEREKANGRLNENALYLTDRVESGTSTGSGFTVDTVACFDFAKSPATVEVQQDGILWGTDESEIELEKDGKIEFATPPFFAKVPIVPGDGVEFEPSTTSDGNPVVRINAEGGSGGGKLYQHNIRLTHSSDDNEVIVTFGFAVYNYSPFAITAETATTQVITQALTSLAAVGKGMMVMGTSIAVLFPTSIQEADDSFKITCVALDENGTRILDLTLGVYEIIQGIDDFVIEVAI